MIRARIGVDGELEGDLQALSGAPLAACRGCVERDGRMGHGMRFIKNGLQTSANSNSEMKRVPLSSKDMLAVLLLTIVAASAYFLVLSPTPAMADDPAPDLVVNSIAADKSSLNVDDSFKLTARVRNQGAVTSWAGKTLRYYRSANAYISTGDTEVKTSTVP